jgi:hypothetical protein
MRWIDVGMSVPTHKLYLHGASVILFNNSDHFLPLVVMCSAVQEVMCSAVQEVKAKGKVVPVLPLTEHHAMKAYWGSGGTAPPIL